VDYGKKGCRRNVEKKEGEEKNSRFANLTGLKSVVGKTGSKREKDVPRWRKE